MKIFGNICWILIFGFLAISRVHASTIVAEIINDSDYSISLRRSNLDEMDVIRKLRIPIEPHSRHIVDIDLKRIVSKSHPSGVFDLLHVQIAQTGQVLGTYQPNDTSSAVVNIMVNKNGSVEVVKMQTTHRVIVEKVINLSCLELSLRRTNLDEGDTRRYRVPVQSYSTIASELALEKIPSKVCPNGAFDRLIIQIGGTGDIVREYQPSGVHKRVNIQIEADRTIKVLEVSLELRTVPDQPKGILKKQLRFLAGHGAEK